MSSVPGKGDSAPTEEAGLDFVHARGAVARHARVTPLLLDRGLTESVGREVWLKLEGLQPTGSFKVRGAASRLEALDEEQRLAGIVACSSGNHGRAVAYVAGRLGVPATVYVPEWVDPVKLRGIEASGAIAVREGASFDESEARALEAAHRRGSTYVSAYDDPWVIAGQGTLAHEALAQWQDATTSGHAPAAFVVPLSGGGLVGGIAAALAGGDPAGAGRTSRGHDADVPLCLAASAERAAVMLASLRAGRPVELPEEETLANALAGGIGPDNRHSFDLVRRRVHHHATVTEEEIAAGMRYAVRRLRLVLEGGGAVALASVLAGAWRDADVPDGPLIVVLSGSNVALETLARVLRA